jgi:hypothetical protein
MPACEHRFAAWPRSISEGVIVGDVDPGDCAGRHRDYNTDIHQALPLSSTRA